MERTPLSSHSHTSRLAAYLAEALLAGPWLADDLILRAHQALGRRPRWLAPFVRRMLLAFDKPSRPTSAALAAFLLQDRAFQTALAKKPLSLIYSPQRPPVMWPSTWQVPPITTPGALASFLEISPAQLDGFADLQARALHSVDGPVRHYRYAWRIKASGSLRLIEAPKPRLKAIQRRLLDEILAPIPPHNAAHAYRPGRSIRTFAEPHAGQEVVLKLDLRDFFPTINAPRLVRIFITAGYPEPVARLLAGLCTNRAPHALWRPPTSPARGPDFWRLRKLYSVAHLPQGAPTSPALANLCAYRLDARLNALAASAQAHYTRYADDLVFSGGPEFARAVSRFSIHVGAIAIEEGFTVNYRKTRMLPRGVRQRVAGVVVNQHPNLARDDFDRLKATLHNCVKLGPTGQNHLDHPDFRAHLSGRVAHLAMLNPSRALKLQALLNAVSW